MEVPVTVSTFQFEATEVPCRLLETLASRQRAAEDPHCGTLHIA